MADILTHLRELSFGCGIFQKDIVDINTPKKFLSFCQKNIGNCQALQLEQVAYSTLSFTKKERDTIINGLALGKYVRQSNVIDSLSDLKLTWIASKNNADYLYDMEVNTTYFSLKENSNILYNMGGYHWLNLFLNEGCYRKGTDLFEVLACSALEKWFLKTRDLACQKLKEQAFIYTDDRKNTYQLVYQNTHCLFYYNDKLLGKLLLDSCKYDDYKKNTTSLMKKIFSYFIHQCLESHLEYIKVKRACAIATGKALQLLLQKNVSSVEHMTIFSKLFRLTDKTYYYAKNANKKMTLYQVPSVSMFNYDWCIKKIEYRVPHSQLNFFIVFENKKTKQLIKMINEFRYSHGQFNGVPIVIVSASQKDLALFYQKVA